MISEKQKMLHRGAKMLLARALELADQQELKGAAQLEYVDIIVRTAYEQWAEARQLEQRKARMR